MIDNLFLQVDKKTARKPRCNKDEIRNTFLGIVRQKKPKYARIRQAKHIHLVELSSCLSSIDKLIASGASFAGLSGHLYRKLLVSSEVYRQQQQMYDRKVNRVDDRIVNFAQPHLRPIACGKAGAKTEFGAKLSASDHNGFVCLDRVEWDVWNRCANQLIN